MTIFYQMPYQKMLMDIIWLQCDLERRTFRLELFDRTNYPASFRECPRWDTSSNPYIFTFDSNLFLSAFNGFNTKNKEHNISTPIFELYKEPINFTFVLDFIQQGSTGPRHAMIVQLLFPLLSIIF